MRQLVILILGAVVSGCLSTNDLALGSSAGQVGMLETGGATLGMTVVWRPVDAQSPECAVVEWARSGIGDRPLNIAQRGSRGWRNSLVTDPTMQRLVGDLVDELSSLVWTSTEAYLGASLKESNDEEYRRIAGAVVPAPLQCTVCIVRLEPGAVSPSYFQTSLMREELHCHPALGHFIDRLESK